jgi:hypothetical protein
MTAIALIAGPLDPPGLTVTRSGIRWLCEDGHMCRTGEVIAYCNIGLFHHSAQSGSRPFPDEWRDLQVGFAAPAAGRLRKAPAASSGGHLDRVEYVFPWKADLELGLLEPTEHCRSGQLRLLFATGRRVTELAEVRSGLLTGWHSRARAWWGHDATEIDTVLGLGTCEQAGIIRGESGAFLEIFEAIPVPFQAILAIDEPLVVCARIAREQVLRTSAERGAIAADMLESFSQSPLSPTAADWQFLGALLGGLQASPATETTSILTRHELTTTGPARTIILSVDSEIRDILLHRRLGYAVCCHDFRMREMGPGLQHWFKTNFSIVRRSVADIAADYRDLSRTIRLKTGARIIVLNKALAPPFNPTQTYAGFSTPLGDTVSSIRDQDMNLMLHDLVLDGDLSIVDVDAITALFGARLHMPDQIHQSAALQQAIRGEILRLLPQTNISS